MSNENNDVIMDNLRDNVHELWVLDSRPDLEADCLQYCYDNIDIPLPYAMIEFLSQHCSQAVINSRFRTHGKRRKKMSNYSEELKSEVMAFVKAERNEEEDKNFIPMEFALPKKDFPIECKNYKTDWLDEEDFLVGFEDIINIIDEENKDE
jgi:hypothetical protein